MRLQSKSEFREDTERREKALCLLGPEERSLARVRTDRGRTGASRSCGRPARRLRA